MLKCVFDTHHVPDSKRKMDVICRAFVQTENIGSWRSQIARKQWVLTLAKNGSSVDNLAEKNLAHSSWQKHWQAHVILPFSAGCFSIWMEISQLLRWLWWLYINSLTDMGINVCSLIRVQNPDWVQGSVRRVLSSSSTREHAGLKCCSGP